MRTMPTVSPLGPTRRTSGTLIRSLILSSVLMSPPAFCPVVSPSAHRPKNGTASASTTAETSPALRGERVNVPPHCRCCAGRVRPRPHSLTRPDDLRGRCGWEPEPRLSNRSAWSVSALDWSVGVKGTKRAVTGAHSEIGAHPRRPAVHLRQREAVGERLQVVGLHDQRDRPV